MEMNRFYMTYRQNQVETATREELLLMLYRGALNFLNKAEEGLEEGDGEKSHHYLVRTQDILAELMSSLNPEVEEEEAGKLVGGLYSLYRYMHHRLIQANLQKETAPVEEIKQLFHSLLEAWQQVLQPEGGGGGPAATAGTPGSVTRHG